MGCCIGLDIEKMETESRNFKKIKNMEETLRIFAKMRIKGDSLKDIALAMDLSEKTVRDLAKTYGRQAYESNYQSIVHGIENTFSHDNKTISEMAGFFGIRACGLKNMLYDLGLLRVLSKEEIVKFLKRGKHMEWIADYFGVTYVTLKNYMNQAGLSHEVIVEEKQRAKSVYPELVLITKEYLSLVSAYELNEQYTEETDIIMSNEKAIALFKRDKKELLRIKHSFMKEYDNLLSIEKCRERYGGELSVYKRKQYGIATKNNFYFRTIALFTETTRPSRTPDYIVERQDKKQNIYYWFTRNGVIRGTKCWGPAYTDTCTWGVRLLDGTEYWGSWASDEFHRIVYGKAKWEEFAFKTDLYEIWPERLCGFNNTCFGCVNQFEGRNILNPEIDYETYFRKLALRY